MIQKHLPLSIEYNIETENIIHHVIELFKAINEEELALQYAQIEKQQNDFGKKKPTKVIKVGRNDFVLVEVVKNIKNVVVNNEEVLSYFHTDHFDSYLHFLSK